MALHHDLHRSSLAVSAKIKRHEYRTDPMQGIDLEDLRKILFNDDTERRSPFVQAEGPGEHPSRFRTRSSILPQFIEDHRYSITEDCAFGPRALCPHGEGGILPNREAIVHFRSSDLI